MKRLFIVFGFVFLLVVMIASAQAYSVTLGGEANILKIPNSGGYYRMSKGKIHLEIYNQGKFIEKFCELKFFDESDRFMDFIYFNPPLTILPQPNSKYVGNFFERSIYHTIDQKKIRWVYLYPCDKSVRGFSLTKERNTSNKILDKLLNK